RGHELRGARGHELRGARGHELRGARGHELRGARGHELRGRGDLISLSRSRERAGVRADLASDGASARPLPSPRSRAYPCATPLSPLSRKPAPADVLIDVDRLVAAYNDRR